MVPTGGELGPTRTSSLVVRMQEEGAAGGLHMSMAVLKDTSSMGGGSYHDLLDAWMQSSGLLGLGIDTTITPAPRGGRPGGLPPTCLGPTHPG